LENKSAAVKPFGPSPQKKAVGGIRAKLAEAGLCISGWEKAIKLDKYKVGRGYSTAFSQPPEQAWLPLENRGHC
jgi:hypothetical protein